MENSQQRNYVAQSKARPNVGLVWFSQQQLPIIDRLPKHPMKAPMIYALLNAYGLTNCVKLIEARESTIEDLHLFHAEDYIEAIRKLDEEELAEDEIEEIAEEFGLKDDCSYFEGLLDYCLLTVGSTYAAVDWLIANVNQPVPPIAINWMGGRHHAKKDEASGFCFVKYACVTQFRLKRGSQTTQLNSDAVLAILRLLELFERVMYIDIDIHHGDGVEQAFILSDKVMTVSFHLYDCGFFPGTGKLDDIGLGNGKFRTVNVPLAEGINDEQYCNLFDTIIGNAVEAFSPKCIVMVCGADLLAGDPLGGFNLTLKTPVHCVDYVAALGKPLLLLGGGGYRQSSVARMASLCTAKILGLQLPPSIPNHSYSTKYVCIDTEYTPVGHLPNKNTAASLKHIEQTILQNLNMLKSQRETSSR